MKARTCPHCNYQYPVSKYLSKFFFKNVKSSWSCSNCQKLITFDRKRRFHLALLFGLWVFILILGKNLIDNITAKWIVSTVLFLVGSVFIFTFDRFDKHTEVKDSLGQ